jgi:phenylalanyl-tRNA synthetase beta subunit
MDRYFSFLSRRPEPHYLERSLSNEEVNELQSDVVSRLKGQFGVEIR